LEAQLIALEAESTEPPSSKDFAGQILDRATEIERLLDQVTRNFEDYKKQQAEVLQKTVKAEAPRLTKEDLRRLGTPVQLSESPRIRIADLDMAGTASVLTDPSIRALIESSRIRLKSAHKRSPGDEVGVSTSAVELAF
jgi:hypothetical protein